MNYKEVLIETRTKWSNFIAESVRNLSDSHTEILSVLLENQELINDISSNVVEEEWKQNSLKSVMSFYDNFIAKDLVGVQALLGPTVKFEHEDNGILKLTSVVKAGTKKLQSVWKDEELTVTDVVGKSFASEMNSEIIADLINNVEKTNVDFQSASDIIKDRIGHEANWMVVKDLNILNGLEGFEATNNSKAIGRIDNKWDVYHIPCELDFDFLMGYKGNDTQTGYVCGPYVPLTRTPVVLCPDDFCPKRGLLTRYAKRLINKDYYLNIKEN